MTEAAAPTMAEVRSTIQRALQTVTDGRVGPGAAQDKALLFAGGLPQDGTTICLNLDSLESLDLLLCLEDHFGQDLPGGADMSWIKTVDDLCSFITGWLLGWLDKDDHPQ